MKLTNLSDHDTISTLTLHGVRICAATRMGGFALSEMRLGVASDILAHDLTATLSTYVMAESLKEATEEVTFSYPASWWQHFKAQCFPTWLARRFPPRMVVEKKTVHFHAREIYPMFPSVRPEDARGHRTDIVVRQFGRRRFDELIEHD